MIADIHLIIRNTDFIKHFAFIHGLDSYQTTLHLNSTLIWASALISPNSKRSYCLGFRPFCRRASRSCRFFILVAPFRTLSCRRHRAIIAGSLISTLPRCRFLGLFVLVAPFPALSCWCWRCAIIKGCAIFTLTPGLGAHQLPVISRLFIVISIESGIRGCHRCRPWGATRGQRGGREVSGSGWRDIRRGTVRGQPSDR
jgi:hypothetical protein